MVYHRNITTGLNMTEETFWDFDSTIIYNIFDLDYHRFIYTKNGIKQFKKFSYKNPIINITDIKHILTARAPYNNYNDIRKDLKKLNIIAKLYLNKNQRKSFRDDIKFKAKILNKYKPKYYIDDDDFMNKLLQQQLTYTKCITTEQYYNREGTNASRL
jgi:hypothetical protein